MAQTRKNRILPLILVLVCAAVMLRSAFTGLEIDEEYALSLGYRLVSGDRLFYDMWEPHQLSSLPAAALLAMFIGITGGTTGVLVFFRLVVLACKAGMSCVFYREFRRDLGKPAALLAALVLFAFVPSGSSARTTPASSSTGRWRRSSACTTMLPVAASSCGWCRWARCAPASGIWPSPKARRPLPCCGSAC